MITPDYKTFRQLSKKHSLVPAFMEMSSDMDTPVTVFSKLALKNPYGILLESVEGGEKLGRYSFISVSHILSFRSKGDSIEMTEGNRCEKYKSHEPINEIKKIFKKLNPATIPQLPRFCGGAIGYAGYDMVRSFERLPESLRDDLDLPDSLFLFTDECVIFDHWKHKMLLIKWNKIQNKSESQIRMSYRKAESALQSLAHRIRTTPVHLQLKHKQTRCSDVRSNLSEREFCEKIERIKEYVRAGDVIQAVFSQRFETDSSVHPFQVYRALRRVNPSPYLYFLQLDQFSIAGSSPEILVRKDGDVAMTRPIAGTRKRGRDEREDLKLEKELLNDPKEKAEHLMLVDLGRNDLGRCCRSGSVEVPEFMKVEKYSHVMHLVSSVEGILKPGEDSFSLFKACFPAGTVSGAAKIRAMEIIEELEKVRRGIYAGSVGYFSYSGNMDMAITIRTMLFKDQKIYMQAGAGIVADSIPINEEKETRSKATALFKAIELAQKEI